MVESHDVGEGAADVDADLHGDLLIAGQGITAAEDPRRAAGVFAPPRTAARFSGDTCCDPDMSQRQTIAWLMARKSLDQ
jgi:hypothetical protein